MSTFRVYLESTRTRRGVLNFEAFASEFDTEWDDYRAKHGDDREGFIRESLDIMGGDLFSSDWMTDMDDYYGGNGEVRAA